MGGPECWPPVVNERQFRCAATAWADRVRGFYARTKWRAARFRGVTPFAANLQPTRLSPPYMPCGIEELRLQYQEKAHDT